MLHKQEHLPFEKAFLRASSEFKGKCFGDMRYGWHFKSAGKKISQEKSTTQWVHISSFDTFQLAEAYVARIKESNEIKNIFKPLLLNHSLWLQEGRGWVPLLITYV